MFYFEDAEYFRKKDEQRLRSFKRLKDYIQNRCDTIKGRTREIPISNVPVKLRDLSKTARSNDQISNIINEVTNTHDEIVQSLSQLHKEDKVLNRKMKALFKKVDDSQQMDWQSDRKYLIIKDELIKMQQDQALPDYCKFCLINSKDTMKRMNRSNQEVKETRLLFQMRDRYPPEQLKALAENLLKKYQRIQQNQELQRNGDGWKLITNRGPKLRSDDTVLIKEHMLKEKELTCSERIKIAQKRYKKQLQEQNQRDAAFKQLKQQNKAIAQFERRIFKTEPDENLVELFNTQLENAKFIQNLNAKLIDDCKTQLKTQLSKMKK